MSKKKRPHGHYCKICGEYKANEKFSGKGHAAHICKSCSRLSAAEKAAAMDINRMMNFPMRRLSDGEKKWLQGKMHDQCPINARKWQTRRGRFTTYVFLMRNAMP